MKVVVVGAAGNQAWGAIWYLLKQQDVSEIVTADIRLDKVKELLTNSGDRRLVAKFIDLNDIDCATKVFKGADVVVNCAYEGYMSDENYMNLEFKATKAALEAGINYIGIGGAPPVPEQLELDYEFKNKGILAILGAGALTGLSQVMTAYAIDKLDRTDSVEIKCGGRDLVSPEEHSRPFLPFTSENRTVANVLRWRTAVDSVSWENGQLHYDAPRARPEVFSFKEPVGAVTIAQTPGAAVISLSRSFPTIKHISFKTGLDPDIEKKINFLYRLGFFDKKPIDVQGKKVSPWEVFMTMVEHLPPETKPADIRTETRVIVKGEKAGKEVEYNMSWTRITSDGLKGRIVPSSGLCAAIAAGMLGRGRTKGKGVLMPEVCIPPTVKGILYCACQMVAGL